MCYRTAIWLHREHREFLALAALPQHSARRFPRRQQLREQGNQISLSIRYRASPGGSILEFQRKALRVAPVVAAVTLERSSRAVRVVICYIQNGNLLQRIKARH